MTRIFRMIGWSSCITWSLLMLPAARADVTYTKTDDDLTVIRMSVTPAAEPAPAFKYRLVARDIDLQSGNAVPYYSRAIAELTRKESRVRARFGDNFDAWLSTGLDAPTIAELPLDEVRKATSEFDWIVDQYLRIATLRRDCDWGLKIEDLRGPEVVAFLLPECQETRSLSRVLAMRTRLAIAEDRYDDALDATRMNYRLARDTAEVPLLVCGLVGIAEAGIANGTMIELIAAPESPNLYWALAELPDPLVDLRQAARFELEFGPRMFPFIHNAETTERAPEEWNRLYTESIRDLATLGDGVFPATNRMSAGLVATATALVGYSRAKTQLIAQGMDPAKVEAMAVGQVIALYTERTYQRFADEYAKLWNMPYWEMRRQGDAVEDSIRNARVFGSASDREVLPIVSLLMPAIHACRSAEVRLERDIAALRVIEALRMYAASHAGDLPNTLAEISEVPVPLNPATGQPFVYRLDGSTAVLELPESDGIPGYCRRFEINIVQPEVSADNADGRR